MAEPRPLTSLEGVAWNTILWREEAFSKLVAINPSWSPPHREASRWLLPPGGVGGGGCAAAIRCSQPFF